MQNRVVVARGLKTLGLAELNALMRRVKRQNALGRISGRDANYIVDRLKEVEAKIVEMHEDGGDFDAGP